MLACYHAFQVPVRTRLDVSSSPSSPAKRFHVRLGKWIQPLFLLALVIENCATLSAVLTRSGSCLCNRQFLTSSLCGSQAKRGGDKQRSRIPDAFSGWSNPLSISKAEMYILKQHSVSHSCEKRLVALKAAASVRAYICICQYALQLGRMHTDLVMGALPGRKRMAQLRICLTKLLRLEVVESDPGDARGARLSLLRPLRPFREKRRLALGPCLRHIFSWQSHDWTLLQDPSHEPP